MWLSPLGKLDIFYHIFGGEFPAVPGVANAYLIPDVIPLAIDYPQPGFREFALAYYQRAVKHGDVLFVYSQHTKQDIIDRLGAQPERIVVTPLAAGAQFYKSCSGEAVAQYLKTLGLSETPYLLAVGTLEPRKNLETLVRAFAHLKRREPSLPHKLVLAGAKWVGFQPIFAAICDEGVENDVVYVGRAERIDLLYRGATAFVFPSLYEGFGLPPLEAMAAGVPVIAANATSVPEVVSDAGILFEPKDVPGLTAAMSRVLQDPQLQADLRQKGLRRAAQFSWDRTAAAFYDGLQLGIRNFRGKSSKR
jgi:glycosyltransferase involved in cell wall biosynthesis